MAAHSTTRPGRDLSQVAARVEAITLIVGTLTLVVIALPPVGRLWLAAWTAIALAGALIVGRAIHRHQHPAQVGQHRASTADLSGTGCVCRPAGGGCDWPDCPARNGHHLSHGRPRHAAPTWKCAWCDKPIADCQCDCQCDSRPKPRPAEETP